MESDVIVPKVPSTFEAFVADPRRVAGVMDEVYGFGDRMMIRLILLHGVIAIFLAAFYRTWLLSFIVAGAAVSMFLASVTLLPRHRTTRVIAGIVLQTFVALHIYQLHGLPEMHFFFFTAFTAMVVYQDGLSMWPGTVLIILQHILFALLHNTGTNLYFFEDPYIGIQKLCFHFGIAILQVALCNVWAYSLRRRALMDAFQREGLLQTQAEAEARRRAEDAARAKGEFLATMSHEMRTPLNGIMGMGELLSRTSLDSKQSEQLDMMRTCADNLLALVSDVLDLSKIEAGRLDIERRPFESRAVVDDVLAINATRASTKNVDLVAIVERGVPDHLIGDVTRVRQTLTNLVSNAVKFTSSGEVEIRVSADPVPAAERRFNVRFSVRDTGIGIDEKTRVRLFQPFSQADSSIARRYGGSGLGLAICKRLVEAMGGSIGVESRPGRGSTFYFELPCDAGEPAPLPEVWRGKVAIVASRHSATREAMAEALVACSMTVRPTASGSDAVCIENADLAIIDSAMPADDIDAIAQRVGRTKVLFLTRSDASAPSWTTHEVRWPVRHGVLAAAALGILDPTQAPARRPARGLSWRSAEGTRALLVEDNPVNQAVALAVLEHVGLRTDVADNGEQALERLEATRYDVVLMDCQMPVLDGYEATRRWREREKRASSGHVPIVALTAQALAGDEARCRDAGMDDYLTKPFERRALITVLEKLLPAGTSDESDRAARTIPQPPATSDADLTAIDAFITSFTQQVGADAMRRVLGAVVRELPGQLDNLRSVSVGTDAQALARLAHALRGAAGNIGLEEVGGKLAEIERTSSTDLSHARQLAGEVEQRLRIVWESLQRRPMTN